MNRFIGGRLFTLGVVLAWPVLINAQATPGPPTGALPEAPSPVSTDRSVGSGLAAADWDETVPPPDPAGNKKSSSTFGRGIKRGLKDQWQIYSGPLRSKQAAKWDVLFVAVTGALIASDKHVSSRLPREHVTVSRRISDVGLYSAEGAAGGLFISSLFTHNRHAREAGTLALEALGNATAVYVVIQLATGRERPLEGTGRGRFGQNHALDSSFPSGHTIQTWSISSVLAREYPTPLVRWLAYGTAVTVAATRVTGLKHFPSDVVAGSFFGYFIGRYLFHSHCRVSISRDCAATP